MSVAEQVRIQGLDSRFCSVYGLSHKLAGLDRMNPGATRQDLLYHATSDGPLVLHDAFHGTGPNPSADLYGNQDAKTARRELAMLSANAKQQLKASFLQAHDAINPMVARKFALQVAICAAMAGTIDAALFLAGGSLPPTEQMPTVRTSFLGPPSAEARLVDFLNRAQGNLHPASKHNGDELDGIIALASGGAGNSLRSGRRLDDAELGALAENCYLMSAAQTFQMHARKA